MRLSVAAIFLTLHYPPSAEAQTCGVSGPFTLSDITGSCSYAVLLEEYARQVFDAPGATCSTGPAVTAKDDLDAKLVAAYPGSTAEEAGDILCKAMYDDDSYETPFVNAADKNTDPDDPDNYLQFEKQFYNGRGEWQEEVETIYETDDFTATSVLREDASKVREFFEGDGSYSRVTWPGDLTNFNLDESCSSHAAMCCWPKDRQANDGNGNCATPYDENCVNKDPADNTNLCFADYDKGNKSTGFGSEGFAVFPEDNGDGEGPIHCHGFAWADDEYDTTSRYKANNLFFVSMYDHMHQRGYVENIPGMPMCACLDQMPIVTRSDCTQVDLTEDWEVVFDGATFQGRLTKVEIDFNACQGRNNHNNNLWAYAARLYDDGRMTAKQFGEVGRVITNDHNCYHHVEHAKAVKGFVTDYEHDVDSWTKVAGRDELKDGQPYGRAAFNSAFDLSYQKIIMRICPDCIPSHGRIFYKRISDIPDNFDLLHNILYHHSSGGEEGNQWGTDFTLHSTYEDAVTGDNPWKCPNDHFNYYEPFNGQCSPDGTRRHDQYSIWNWYPGPRLNVAYYVNKAEAEGPKEYIDHGIEDLTDIDIGNVGIAGSTLEDNGTFHIVGSGNDIWWYRDQFRFKSVPWTGDIDVSVHVTEFSNPARQTWAKAGIMLRSDNSDDATYAFAHLTGRQGIYMQARRSKGNHAFTVGSGHNVPEGGFSYSLSAWLRIVKKQELIYFYYGDGTPDGWVLHADVKLLFPDDSYRVGLAVTSHDNSWLAEATFEDYHIEEYLFPTSAPSNSNRPTMWEPSADIGVPDNLYYSGDFYVENDIDVVRGVGSDLWGTSDSFFFYREQYDANADLSVEMQIERFQNWNVLTRGGLMIRDGDGPSAANAFVGAAGHAQGVVFQSRGAEGSPTDHHGMIYVNGHNQFWVKLSLHGQGPTRQATAYYKVQEGDDWIELGDMGLQLTGNHIQIGRAVTAGSTNIYARETMQTKNYVVTTSTV